jgi:hypothetical protein
MTDDETEILNLLADAWNVFVHLPVEHSDDITEFRQGIHAMQNTILARPTRRTLMEKHKLSVESG